MTTFADSFFGQSWFIVLVLIVFFGGIVFAVIMLKRHAGIFKSDEAPKSEEEVAKEELARVLEDVEDENAAKQMAEFNQEEALKDEAPEGQEELGEDKPLEK
ncbi:MAG: hypothetical protein J6328_04865 [Bacilli bacterium]|nr:hypothetical protein [Bacilli bacterium]